MAGRLMRLVAVLLWPYGAAATEVPAGTEIVLLGEVHDNPAAHLRQADVIASLDPKVVVFEMLTPEQAARVDADRQVAETIWAEGGWPDFALYAPVFDALGAASIRGMAASRETNRQVFAEGPAAAFGGDAARFGLLDPLPEAEQTAREKLQFDAHCGAMPAGMMGGMVNVQRYWDARFARLALEALAEFGAPVVMILGNGHARTDWGVPAVLAQAAPEVSVFAVGFVEADHDLPFDTSETVPPAQRDDPCAALEQG